MLKELTNPRQHPGEPRRRLYWDDYLQLCVWFDPQDAPLGFELSYDPAGDCRAFRCMPGPEVEHYAVDDGESRALRKAIAILHADRSHINREIHHEFRNRNREIEPEIAEIVQQKLEDYLAAIDLFAE
ncbi:MAG: hypothetical protein ACO1SX_27350 [Actinomycetota bacterium]